MASARHLGRIHFLAIGGTPLPAKCEVSSAFNTTSSDINATCKSDSGQAFKLSGTRDTTIDVTMFVDYETDAGAYTWAELHTDALAGTTVAFEHGTGVVGDQMISGSGIWQNVSISANDEEGTTGTATLSIQGAYTLATQV